VPGMSMPKAGATAIATFEGFLPVRPDVQRRPVFGQPAAFVGGNMFLGVFGDRVFVRLSEADRALAEKTVGATTFEPMPGRPMREYMVLPAAVWKDRKKAMEWVDRSLQYARELPAKKPKPPK
ncbi:MAG: TfoX/Sxy family protein, partial [Thermoplasmata archaeon]|nr:TfoX/Sxy family protein [Thermoplasmata archaeon]